LGLAGNEERRRRWYGWRWWVTAILAVAGECHRRRGEGEEEEEEEKKKKNRGVCGCFVLILVCTFFLGMLIYQLVSGGQKTPPFCTAPPFCTDRIATVLFQNMFHKTFYTFFAICPHKGRRRENSN
jgi:hypothetical protein